MHSLTEFFINNNKLTILLSIFLVVGGLIGVAKLNSESYPPVDFAMATVVTSYDGATPEDIETKITKPIEDEIRMVSGLKDVRSISQAGLSKILVRVDMDNEDVSTVMTDIQKAVDRVSKLPSDLRDEPIFQEIKSEEFPAINIAVIGLNDKRRDALADQLKEDLEDNKRILNVRLNGFRERQFRIEMDHDLMLKEHIGINDVIGKVQKRNVNIPGGELKKNEQQDLVRLSAKIESAKDLEEMLIRSNFSGEKIRIGDVGKIYDDQEEARDLARYNGEPATLLIVNKKAGADTIALVEDVEKILERYKKSYQNEFQFVVYNNEAEKVKNRLDILSSNAFSGLFLVIFFLLIFLPGKIGLMAALSLPLAVMATLGLMPAFDMNLNTITILALVIALGMLVDNSVVISENYARLRIDGLPSYQAAITSVQQLWLPITITAFTTIFAFLPMLITKGIMGEFIKYIPIVVTLSLLISLVESFFLLPMRLTSIKNLKKVQGGGDWFDHFSIKFERLMSWVISNRYKVGAIFSATLIFSFFMMYLNGFNLFPADQTEIYIARLEMPPGTTLERTTKVVEQLSEQINKQVGQHINHLVGQAGIASLGPTDPKEKEGANIGMVILYVNEFAKFNVSYKEMLAQLRKIEIPQAQRLEFQELINGPPVGAAINATFRSNKLQNIDTLISKITNDLAKLTGISDLITDDEIGDNEVNVKIDYIQAERLGLEVNDIGNTIRAAIAGKVISDVTLDNKEIDILIRLKADNRNQIKDLSLIKIRDPLGNLVPLSQVASFDLRSGSSTIKRFDFKRSKTLSGNVDNINITSPQANQALLASYKKHQVDYPDVSLVFGGQQEQTKESLDSLGQAGILASLGIFSLLVFLFRSFLRPLIIMMTIPLGLLGYAISFYFHGKPNSFLSLIGIIGLAGIIVNSGIVLISFIEQLKNEGKMNLEEILVKASGMRLRAVLVTSLTTISGLFPTAYGIGGSDAILVPMTLAMAWGLTSGTILTLIWVPCAYMILEDLFQFLGHKKKIRENDGV